MKYLKGLIFGITYGLVARGIFTLEDKSFLGTNGLMTLSFMFIVPLVVGLITAHQHKTITSSGKILVLAMPLFSIIGLVLTTVLLGHEGIICAFMALPVFAIMAFIGGLIGVYIFERKKNDKLFVSVFLFIPFLIAPIENYFGLNEKIFTEHTTITINSTDIKVWQNITRVKAIAENENHNSLFQFMGFPRPIEAELDTVAIGGIRKAIFARGLFFTETVTEVVPNKVLAFNIKSDPNSTPPTALDEHVMVGGKYFDVLDGIYEIEKISDNKINLHLTSKFRLSTNFNFYSGLWSKVIMRDIQENILQIIKDRSETK